ncbi:DUF3304 domain-containing protein [Stenotrophomonas terrae]|uniref:DUF3304 domain-containing protein n=1 Tax=Stenotrophomonas terrae TaxID=405446 RepID=UPI003207D883
MSRYLGLLKIASFRNVWWFGFLLAVFSIGPTGCESRESRAKALERERLIAIGQWPPNHKPGDLVPMGIGLLNYTDEEIDEVYVGSSWAANVPKHSSSTGAGSADTPAFYDPNYKINVRWRNESLFKSDEKALFNRDMVPEVPQKDRLGRMTWLWIAFFPDGSVKLFPTFASPGDPDFPDGLIDPTKTCIRERPDNRESCY